MVISARTELGIVAGAVALGALCAGYAAVDGARRFYSEKKHNGCMCSALVLISAIGAAVGAGSLGALAFWSGKAVWLKTAVAFTPAMMKWAYAAATAMAVSVAAECGLRVLEKNVRTTREAL